MVHKPLAPSFASLSAKRYLSVVTLTLPWSSPLGQRAPRSLRSGPVGPLRKLPESLDEVHRRDDPGNLSNILAVLRGVNVLRVRAANRRAGVGPHGSGRPLDTIDTADAKRKLETRWRSPGGRSPNKPASSGVKRADPRAPVLPPQNTKFVTALAPDRLLLVRVVLALIRVDFRIRRLARFRIFLIP